ncbi:MAG: lysophospholipid acyltransferase family protein [Tepidisphaeraceae bacterium]
MSDWFYAASKLFCRFVKRQCLHEVILHGERAKRTGGYLLACTHVSHVEPFLMTGLIERPIVWMARIEFYRLPVLGSILRLLRSISVHRQGVPVRAIRDAIDVARGGGIVGIFPEGGCRKGKDLAFRGGRIKRGACVIATRAQVPILPVVILGTDKLTAIDPWLPAMQGKIWIAFGRPIDPPPIPSRADRRRGRETLARNLEAEFTLTYQDLLSHAGLNDAMTP